MPSSFTAEQPPIPTMAPSDIRKVYAVIEQLEEHQVPFLLHGEVTHSHVDIFDREKRF